MLSLTRPSWLKTLSSPLLPSSPLPYTRLCRCYGSSSSFSSSSPPFPYHSSTPIVDSFPQASIIHPTTQGIKPHSHIPTQGLRDISLPVSGTTVESNVLTSSSSPSSAGSLSRSLTFFSNRLNHSTYDITIVGGGMVGATIALALADSPITRHLKVCLIESSTPKLNLPLQPTPSIRVSAVSPASAAFFQRIGAWERMAAKRVTPFHKMHVWHTERHGRIEWDLRQMRGEQVEPARLAESETTNETDSALGWIIENDVIQNSLWEAMAELMSVNGGSANLEILSPVKIDKIQSGASDGDAATSDWPHLILSNSQHVRTRLLIGADGPNSIVKQFSSGTIDTIGKDYGQRAVVATLQLEPTSSSKNDIAYQRFLPTGPIALLPCHEEYVNLVWSTTPAHAQYLTAKTTTPEEFVQLVNQAIQAEPEQFHPLARLSSLLPSPLTSVTDFLFPPLRPTSLPSVTRVFGPRLSFPLRLQQSSSYRSDRVALAGDAAHVIHPMAGQGVNLGFGDAEALVNTIETNVTSGLDIGTRDSLTPYDTARWSHTSCILGGVDAIGSAFQLGGPLAQIRSIGLDLFSAVPAIKKKAAKTAMGIKL